MTCCNQRELNLAVTEFECLSPWVRRGGLDMRPNKDTRFVVYLVLCTSSAALTHEAECWARGRSSDQGYIWHHWHKAVLFPHELRLALLVSYYALRVMGCTSHHLCGLFSCDLLIFQTSPCEVSGRLQDRSLSTFWTPLVHQFPEHISKGAQSVVLENSSLLKCFQALLFSFFRGRAQSPSWCLNSPVV